MSKSLQLFHQRAGIMCWLLSYLCSSISGVLRKALKRYQQVSQSGNFSVDTVSWWILDTPVLRNILDYYCMINVLIL